VSASRSIGFAVTAMAVALAAPGVEAVESAAPAGAPAVKARHEIVLAVGPSSNGTSLLFSWTSPKRVGLFARMFPTLKDDHDPEVNSTITDESAGELGIAVRIMPWLTVGAGYGRYEKVVTAYGDTSFLFGIPGFLSEETSVDKGVSALAIFAVTPRSKPAALSLTLSLSPAGSGAGIGVLF
jgi:hypothetical protein